VAHALLSRGAMTPLSSLFGATLALLGLAHCGSSSDSAQTQNTTGTTIGTGGAAGSQGTAGDFNVVRASDASATGGSGGGGGLGDGGSGGSAGHVGVSDAAVADVRKEAAAVVPCPAQPPDDKGPCGSVSRVCTYVDCATYGHVQAYCNAKTWSLAKLPCGAVPCGFGGQDCKQDEICKEVGGGALQLSCLKNTCAPGVVTCDCIDCGGCSLNDLKLTCTGCLTCP